MYLLTVLLQMMIAQYLFKVGYEVLFTPSDLHGGAQRQETRENIDIFDTGIVYNPFEFGEK